MEILNNVPQLYFPDHHSSRNKLSAFNKATDCLCPVDDGKSDVVEKYFKLLEFRIASRQIEGAWVSGSEKRQRDLVQITSQIPIECRQ